MTNAAFITIGALMRIVPAMTGETILRYRLQIHDTAGIEVTLCAIGFGMFASQLKRELIMIKVVAVAINTIMAGQTICPERQDMCLGEDNIHLTVAAVAGVGCEGCHILTMAILADKRFARRPLLMPFQ